MFVWFATAPLFDTLVRGFFYLGCVFLLQVHSAAAVVLVARRCRRGRSTRAQRVAAHRLFPALRSLLVFTLMKAQFRGAVGNLEFRGPTLCSRSGLL